MSLIKFPFAPGIRRDGQPMDDNGCIDGNWVRFNSRNNPESMGGYRHLIKKDNLLFDGSSADISFRTKDLAQYFLVEDKVIGTEIKTAAPIAIICDNTEAQSSYTYTLDNDTFKTASAIKFTARFPEPTGSQTKTIKITVTGWQENADGSSKEDPVNEVLYLEHGQTVQTVNRYRCQEKPTAQSNIPVIIKLEGQENKNIDINLASRSILLPHPVTLEFVSKIRLSSNRAADEDIKMTIFGDVVLKSGISVDNYQEDVTIAKGQTSVATQDKFKKLHNILIREENIPDLFIYAEQEEIECFKNKKLSVPCSLFLNAPTGLSVKITGVDYFTKATRSIVIVANGNKANKLSTYTEGIYFSSIESAQIIDPLPPGTLLKSKYSIGLRDFVVLKDTVISPASKLTFNCLNVVDSVLVIKGNDAEGRYIVRTKKLSNSKEVTIDEYSFVQSAIVQIVPEKGFFSSFKLTISTKSTPFLKGVSLTPASTLEFHENTDGLIEEYIIEKGSILANGQILEEDLRLLVPLASKSVVTTDRVKYIAGILCRTYPEGAEANFSIYSSGRSPQGGTYLLPRKCAIYPSVKHSGRWHLIVGTSADNQIQEGFSNEHLVKNFCINEDGKQLDRQPLSINSLTEQTVNRENVSWVFDSFSIQDGVKLLALKTNSLHSISADYPANPVLFVDLDQTLDNAKLQPLSLSAGFEERQFDYVNSDGVYCHGVFVLYPYLIFYNYAVWDGVEEKASTIVGSIAFTHDGAKAIEGSIIKDTRVIASSNLVYGVATRGGSNSPSGLLWSTNSLHKVSYVGGDTIFRFDVIGSSITILSSSCVIESNGLFFWSGIGCFYAYNGSVQILENRFNQDFFFDNLDFEQRQKVWGIAYNEHHELIWHYPNKNLPGYVGECNAYIVFNTLTKEWYDGYFPVTAADDPLYQPTPDYYPNPQYLRQISKGRSCGVQSQFSKFPICFENTKSKNPWQSGGQDQGEAYRPYLHEIDEDHAFPAPANISPVPQASVPEFEPLRLFPIFSFIRSGVFSCLYKQQGADQLSKIVVNSVSPNVKGKGFLKLDILTSSFLQEGVFINAGKAYTDLQGQGLQEQYPTYDIILPDDTIVCKPQAIGLGHVAPRNLVLNSDNTSVSLLTDGRIKVTLEKALDGSVVDVRVKGTYGSTKQPKEELIQVGKKEALGSQLFREVTEVEFLGGSPDSVNFISVGFVPPTASDFIRQSQDPNVLTNGAIVDRSTSWKIATKESAFFISFVIQKYNLKGFCELGSLLLDVQQGEIGKK